MIVRASRVVAGLALVLGVVPLRSCVRVERLKGVALASTLPSTEATAPLDAASPSSRLSRPAVLFACWALGAQPEDLLGTPQSHLVRKFALSRIALVVPLCQEGVIAIRKCWMLRQFLALPFIVNALLAASLSADPHIGCCLPLVPTVLAVPCKHVTILRHHIVRCTVICVIVPLSCNQGSLGSQGVVLAHLVAAALRTLTAIASVLHSR